MNVTGIMNHTEVFDIYCIGLFVGPLVWAIFSLPCACVGEIASVWLLWVLIQRQRSSLSNDIYMVNLTIMDLIFNISVAPTVFNYFFWHNNVFLRISDCLYSLNMSGRPLFMTCMCVDCYMAVVHPVLYMNLKHSKYRLVTCVSVWVLTLSYGVVLVFPSHQFIALYSAIPYIFTVPAIAVFDLSILCALRKPNPSGKSTVHPQKQRALHTITNSLIMTVVSYLPPLLVFGIIAMFPVNNELFCHISLPTMMISTLGSTILPLLYLGNLGSMKDLWRCGCARCLKW